MRQKVYFRADASADIGYGHYIRSLALANMLKHDFDCTIYTQTPTQYQLREAEHVCAVVALPNDDSRFESFLNILEGDEIVVLDNYFFTIDYQRAIKEKGCKLVCIDDMHDKHYVADAVINHCINDKSLFDVATHTQLCLGTRYALLRAPFLEKIEAKKIIPWLVCFGGADSLDLTGKYIELLLAKGITHTVAIVGDAYKYKERLALYDGITVLSGISAYEMASYLAQTENVICSASTICYEALSQQCKVYAGWYVDNQKEFYEELVSNNHIIPLGNLTTAPITLNSKQAVSVFSNKFTTSYLRGLFIYLSLVSYNYTDLPEDLNTRVWQCRNLPEIREHMSNPQPFDQASHNAFVQRLKTDDTRLYIAYFWGDDFVASFNLVDIKKSNSASRGLFINPKYQAMKIASHIDHQIESIARERFNILSLDAEVLKSNTKSYHYHLRNGYLLDKEDAKYYYFKKNLG